MVRPGKFSKHKSEKIKKYFSIKMFIFWKILNWKLVKNNVHSINSSSYFRNFTKNWSLSTLDTRLREPWTALNKMGSFPIMEERTGCWGQQLLGFCPVKPWKDPVIGGIFAVMTALPAAVGMSSLQFVNMNKSRNLFVLGFSVFMGIVIPGTDFQNM